MCSITISKTATVKSLFAENSKENVVSLNVVTVFAGPTPVGAFGLGEPRLGFGGRKVAPDQRVIQSWSPSETKVWRLTEDRAQRGVAQQNVPVFVDNVFDIVCHVAVLK